MLAAELTHALPNEDLLLSLPCLQRYLEATMTEHQLTVVTRHFRVYERKVAASWQLQAKAAAQVSPCPLPPPCLAP